MKVYPVKGKHAPGARWRTPWPPVSSNKLRRQLREAWMRAIRQGRPTFQGVPLLREENLETP